MLDTIIVGAIVLLATVYAGYKIFYKKSSGCEGCNSCSKGGKIQTSCSEFEKKNH